MRALQGGRTIDDVTSTRLGQADARKRVAAASEYVRALGRQAPPWTRSDNADGTVTFTAADGEHLFTIDGMWARPVADYIDAFHPHVGVGIGEVFWQLGIGKDPIDTAAGVADRLLRTRRVDGT